MTASPRLLVWADSRQKTLVHDTITAGALHCVGIGTPHSPEGASLAKDLGIPLYHDLRHALHDTDVDLVWLAAMDPLEREEREILRSLLAPVFSSEPRPVHVRDLIEAPEEASTAIFTPRFSCSPGFRGARDTLVQFGDVHQVHLAFIGSETSGTLYARLFDAMDTVLRIAGNPDGVQSASPVSRMHATETLGDMQGHLTALCRYPEHRSASILASNAAGIWKREATILGPSGRLLIHDHGFLWTGPDGTIVDEMPSACDGALIREGQLHADQFIRHLTLPPEHDPSPNVEETVSLCEAVRLGMRTGQIEEPGKVVEMFRRG